MDSLHSGSHFSLFSGFTLHGLGDDQIVHRHGWVCLLMCVCVCVCGCGGVCACVCVCDCNCVVVVFVVF